MKKGKLLNSELSYEISKVGHTDTITIGDAGLPIPSEVKRIDLAVTLGVPSFIEVLKTVLEEMKVEKIVLAQEIKENNLTIYNQILNLIEKEEVEIEFVTHSKFKELTKKSKTVVRTGECTPYANIILQSGVVF